jgi:hypothetical protein
MTEGDGRGDRGPGGLDWTRLTRADRLVLEAGAAFLVWSLLPVWYRFLPGGIDTPGFETRINAWHGVTVVSGAMAATAVLWVLARTTDVRVRIQPTPAVVDLGLAAGATLFSIIGVRARPAFFSTTWGLYVGIVLSLAWCCAAGIRFLEPAGPGPLTRRQPRARPITLRRRPRTDR